MEAKFKELKSRLLEVDNLNSAAALLHWDQTTYMPPGGASARARQIATLSRLAHEKLIDPDIGNLLDVLRPYGEGLPYHSDEASLLRTASRKFERAARVPASFAAELSEHSSASFDNWTRARPANDFAATQPFLERNLDLSRGLAEFFPGYQHIADPLIDFADHGMTASTITALFKELRKEVVPIVKAISVQPIADDSCLHQRFPEAEQLAFGAEVVKQFGYQFDRGRQDKTHHPFMTKFSLGDVRITTRVNEQDLGEALFSTMHEAGHALYEQGIPLRFEGSVLADGASAGIHESQSRLWENLVGRSWGFWKCYYPRLRATFPSQLGDVSLEVFYRAINKVEPSLIRTDADEVTYNLHVMIRFDLELALLEGSLAVRDLPEAWTERYEADLGVVPPDDRDGVLQDVHWFSGPFGGAFQGYTLGNIVGIQLYDAAVTEFPDIPQDIENGDFDNLYGWLNKNIYQHGDKYTATELIESATGGSLSIEPHVHYLRSKFGDLYDL